MRSTSRRARRVPLLQVQSHYLKSAQSMAVFSWCFAEPQQQSVRLLICWVVQLMCLHCRGQGRCRMQRHNVATRASAVQAPPSEVESTLSRSFNVSLVQPSNTSCLAALYADAPVVMGQGAVPAADLLAKLDRGLQQHGFTGENTIGELVVLVSL